MPRHVWSVLCKVVITDQQNMLSLVQVPERVHVEPEIIAQHTAGNKILLNVDMSLVSMWWDDGKGKAFPEVRMTVRSPSGKTLGHSNVSKLLQRPADDPIGASRVITGIAQLPFVGLGIYELLIESKASSKWKRETSVPLQMIPRKQSD